MCSIHVAEEAAHTGTAEFFERMDQLFKAFNSQTLTSPSLMQHALTVTIVHKVFLLGILNWLSKIKSRGNDSSILILLDVVSFVVNILDYYMYQVDLSLNKMAYFDFLNQIKASYFKHPVIAMTYTWLLLMSFECHISIALLVCWITQGEYNYVCVRALYIEPKSLALHILYRKNITIITYNTIWYNIKLRTAKMEWPTCNVIFRDGSRHPKNIRINATTGLPILPNQNIQ